MRLRTKENLQPEKFERYLKREKRKSVVHENGVKYYNFDFNKEYQKYVFLCGEKNGRKCFKELQEDEKFYTYAGWKYYIRNKYSKEPASKLKEFNRYLNHRKRKYPSLGDYMSSTLSAIVSAFLGCIISILIDEKNIFTDSLIWNIFSAIFFVAVIVLVGIVVASLVDMFTENGLKKNFYEDYMEIIDEIICEKIQKFECLHGMKPCCYMVGKRMEKNM